MLHAALLAAALAMDPPAAPAPPDVEGVVVTAVRPTAGDFKQGTVAYRPEFFTPVRPASAMDMVSWLPGFVFEDTRDMRGLEGSTGNVLIDGKPPTSKTDTLTSVLKRIPADQVERVDLILGGAPGINMHGRNVIANVVLKTRDKPLTVVTAAAHVDTHGAVSPDLLATYSDKRNGRALEASGQITRNNAIFPTYGYGPWIRLDGTGAVEFAANERFIYDGPYAAGNVSYEFPLAGGRLRLSGLLRLTHETQDEHDALTSGPGTYGYRHVDDYGQGEIGLRYERAFGKTSLEAQALGRYQQQATQDDLNRPPEPSTDTIHNRLAESIQRLVLRYKPSDALTLEGSAEHAFNDGYTHTEATLDGAPQVLPVATTDVTEDRWEGGSALTFKPSGLLSLDAALNLEASRLAATGDVVVSHELVYVKPRLALAFSPDKDDQLRLRLEDEVSQIPFGAFVTFNEYQSGQLRYGNPDIRPPQDWVVEAVGERRFWDSGDLTVTARYKALADVLDVVPGFTADGTGYEIISNIGGGRETDVVGNLMVPLKRFGLGSSTVRAVITWRKARVTDPVSGLERNLSVFPELSEELHFAQDLPRWRINWGLDAMWEAGRTLYRPFGNESSDSWLHLNLYVERRFEHDTTLRVEVDNLPGQAPKNTIEAFSGLRTQSTLLYVDVKRLSVGPILYLRLRKTL